ncbi:MAG: hypothetical protein SFV22_14670 [Saprospiraceae bacterium]|nr:hypothetical protein [Saprospiraceae bacterium]
MNHPSAIFPNETYLEGLRNADATVIEALYHEFRQPVSRAVEAAGGSYADGNTFFRVALIQTAGQVQQDKYPQNVPVFLYLKWLAIAQYRNWLTEKIQELPPEPAQTEEETPILEKLPAADELRNFRGIILAKRTFTKLPAEEQKKWLLEAETTQRRLADENQVDEEPGITPPSDGDRQRMTALLDKHFHQTWSACEAIEKRLEAGKVPTTGDNKAIRYAFVGFLVLTLGYAIFTWIYRDRSPEEVYDQNFQPPASIVADRAARYLNDTLAPEMPEDCEIMFREADAQYQKKAWREAAASLAVLLNDSLKVCQSDALFYLSIIGLQMDRPELTIDCIAKIEDLERYGEDLYWYLALAYVKIAAQNPSEKDMARRAVQRALSNTEIPERRSQAEKMLEELSE